MSAIHRSRTRESSGLSRLSENNLRSLSLPVSQMPKYRVEALEKFIVRTVYNVEADTAEDAVRICQAGSAAYEQSAIEEGDEEWLESVSINRA